MRNRLGHKLAPGASQPITKTNLARGAKSSFSFNHLRRSSFSVLYSEDHSVMREVCSFSIADAGASSPDGEGTRVDEAKSYCRARTLEPADGPATGAASVCPLKSWSAVFVQPITSARIGHHSSKWGAARLMNSRLVMILVRFGISGNVSDCR
jgi:hypothetical protein